MKKKAVVIANVILVIAVSFSGLQCTSVDKPEVGEPAPPSSDELTEKPVGPQATPIPREEWPPLPPRMGPPPMPSSFSLPIPPEATGYVIGVPSSELNRNDRRGTYIAMKIISPEVSLDNFDIQITFDPRVIRIDYMAGHAGYLRDYEVDNTQGIIKFTVNPSYPSRSTYDRWIDLGALEYIGIGNPGDSTVLHLTITTPVENVTPVDGIVRILPTPPGLSSYTMGIESIYYSGWKGFSSLYMQVINSDVSLDNFDVQIGFNPKVITIDNVTSYYDRLYNIEVDNTTGIIKLSVKLPQDLHPFYGYLNLGRVEFTAIGNRGDSTVLHLTITTPVENVTPFDGFIRRGPPPTRRLPKHGLHIISADSNHDEQQSVVIYLVVNPEVSLEKFDAEITFDPKVIRIDDVTSDYGLLYNCAVDNALGIIKLSVNPPQGLGRYFGYLPLGRMEFTAIGNSGDSTVLHFTITTPVESVYPNEGIIRIKSEN